MLNGKDQRVLVLAPHPDDESLGCGGTVNLIATSGIPVDICFVTRGERGTEIAVEAPPAALAELAEIRTAEAEAAARILGAAETSFLGGADGRVSEQPQLADRLIHLLARGRYTRVFAPWPREHHPDHQATFRLLQRALGSVPHVASVWLYEVWTPLAPNNYVPIDGAMETKRRAIEAHRSQLACLDYLHAFVGLAAYRALACPPSQFAEAFIVLESEAVQKLA